VASQMLAPEEQPEKIVDTLAGLVEPAAAPVEDTLEEVEVVELKIFASDQMRHPQHLVLERSMVYHNWDRSACLLEWVSHSGSKGL